jgi:hypothetical protein
LNLATDRAEYLSNNSGEWMMAIWKGTMQAGFLEISVIVTYTRSSTGVTKWYGSGVTDRYWPRNQPQFETNIGTVLIVKDEIRSNGGHYIEFKGSGNPDGALAERMG